MEIKESTPIEFIDYIKGRIGMSAFDDFKIDIKDQMAIHRCPYSIFESKKRDITSYVCYKCRFKDCPSHFSVKFRDSILCNCSGEWIHNHSMNKRYVESFFCLLTSKQKEEINDLRSKGASPYFIRKNLNLSISSNQLYNYSRNALAKTFINEIEQLETESQEWSKKYIVTFQKKDDEFHGLTLINSSIISKPYAQDICVMDDTMCTNKYRYPIILCYCYDENDKAQMIALGILLGKTFNDFVDFLIILSKYINFRIFICDRLESQRKAIKYVFKTSKIVFCRVHILRNVADHCGVNSVIYQTLIKLFHGEMKASDFVSLINNEIQKNTKEKPHLQLLLKHLKYYDPEILAHYRLRNHYTSNLAEGNFSTIKNWIDHKIVTLKDIIDAFLLHAEMLIKKNIATKRIQINLDLYHGKQLGNLCSNILNTEYERMNNIIKVYVQISPLLNGINPEDCNCKVKTEFGLPCCHILFNRYKAGLFPLVKEEDIPDIYFTQHFDETEETEIQTVQVETNNNYNMYKYTNLMDMVSPIAAEANRNPEIRKLFDDLFIGFNNLKTRSTGSPEFIAQRGRPITKQSLFVDHQKKCGAHKTKRTYRCHKCGKEGHNSATCKL